MKKFNDFFSKYIEIDDLHKKELKDVFINSIKCDKNSKELTLIVSYKDDISSHVIKKVSQQLEVYFNLNKVNINLELIDKEKITEIKNENQNKIVSNKINFRSSEFLSPVPDFSSYTNVFGSNPIFDVTSIDDIKKEIIYNFWGDIFDIKVNTVKNFTVCIIRLTDYKNSITIKVFKNNINKEKFEEIINLNIGKTLIVKGKASFDSFENELIITPSSINLISKHEICDDEKEKRIELHLHTSMSSMDGITNVSKYIERAMQWGHNAVAITDHGVLQSFPEAMNFLLKIKNKNKNINFKIIYGIESYFVNDTDTSNLDAKDIPIFSEYICFDVETTGFSPNFDRIIEIGAIRIKNIDDYFSGKFHYLNNKENFKSDEYEKEIKANTFNSFIKNIRSLPQKIIELTGITDQMLENAPPEKDVIEKFIEFCGENPILIAHNAPFDVSFLNAALKRNNIEFKYKYLDSIPICKSQITTIKNYKLKTVASYFDLGEFRAHRASDDAKVLAIIFLKLIEIANRNPKEDKKNISDLFTKIDVKKEFTYHQTILVKNKIGLKNLYKLVSLSHIKYFYKKPRMPKSEIVKYRDGLLIGSACEGSDLFKAIVSGESDEKLKDIASFYDYLEVQPLANNDFMLKENLVQSIEDLKKFNIKIIQLGEELNIPVVATGDVHFLDPQDYKFRKALMMVQNYKSGLETPLYFKNTKEMLEEFSYLGTEKAFEVVVKNPQKIADMIEDILPIPQGVYPPDILGAKEELIKLSTENSKKRYGENLPLIIKERLERELDSITKHGYSVLYIVAKKLVERSESLGYLVGSRGSVGSSFVAHISGISEVNPLKPHYFCPNCLNSEFILDNSFLSGFDLPSKNCPECNTLYLKDGHDIPFETFLGFDGDKTPDIDLNFSGEYQLLAHKHTEEIFGKLNVFKAGTISTIAEKTAIGFIKKNIEENNLNINSAEARRLAMGITGIKRTTGQHPGGMIVVPANMEIYDFCPVQKPANDLESVSITTHFDFHSIHDTICKLDELGHDVPTTYKYLEKYSGVPISKVDMSDPKIYSLFTSTKALGIKPEDIDSKVGTFSLPEVGTFFVRQMLYEAKPKTFSDLIQISGLSHGTDVWAGNARDLIKNKICTIKEVIGTRDDIMVYLISKGIDKKTSFKIMEIVRKGMAQSKFTQDDITNLKNHGIPQWYIDSCKKIKYMFPKAHATAYMISTIRLAWYKIYYPTEYYAAYFSAHGEDVDSELTMKGIDKIRKKLKEIEAKGKEASIKEKTSISTLQILIEAYARGIEFLPVDIYKSHTKSFFLENKKIRLPLLSFTGLGESVAKAISEERLKGKFISMDDLRHRTKMSKTVTDLMKTSKILNLQESNQISFF